MQLGTYFEGRVCSWSEAMSFPSSSQEASSNDAEDSLSVPVAFVLGSGEIRGARWSVTSRMYRGIEIISIEQRFYVINNVGRPLFAHPVLVMSGKKVMNNYLILILRCEKWENIDHAFHSLSLSFLFSMDYQNLQAGKLGIKSVGVVV